MFLFADTDNYVSSCSFHLNLEKRIFQHTIIFLTELTLHSPEDSDKGSHLTHDHAVYKDI